MNVKRGRAPASVILGVKAMNSPAVLCSGCESPNIRRSALRMADVAHLLLLRYPTRCRECRERHYMSILKALRLPGSPGRMARHQQ